MTSTKAKTSFVASQRALREIIGGYTGTAPSSIRFARGAHGKPQLAAPAGSLHFNVSHSGEWGVVALSVAPVGVDVERVRERPASSAVQERFLTTGERHLLAQRARSYGDRAFYIVWSRKEAYLKAVGLGLAAPFSRIDSSRDRLPDLDANGEPLGVDPAWTVSEFFVDEQHPAAVVTRAGRPSLHFHTLSGLER